jgi:TolB-like protein/tetratricopeptide (TPR) repeat protein
MMETPFQKEVNRVLSSRTLAAAPQLRRFLEYCAIRMSDGREGELKESAIGLDVFGRPSATYDPRVDPIVRVMATRLRKKLDDYYEREAGSSAMRLVLPRGAYLPVLQTGTPTGEEAAAQPVTQPSIAVLPLDNFSGDASQEFFSDGMTEALITGLAKLPGIRVISRTSVARFKRTTTPMDEIARLLGVNHVVEGSVMRDSARVCITVQLIALPVERHLWAETYERDLGDVFRLQQDIAREVASEVHVRLAAPVSVPVAPRRVNQEAWLSYSRGLFVTSRSYELEKALEHYENAVRLDRDFALAYAALAELCFFLEAYEHRTDLHVRARMAATRALALEPNSAEAHTAMAAVLTLEWNWAGACEHLEAALRANPNSSTACRRFAFTLALLGRAKEAREKAERALELDPLSAMTRDTVGLVLFFGGQYEEAEEHLRALVAADPSFPPARIHLTLVLLELGQYEEAAQTISKLIETRPLDLNAVALLCATYSRSGRMQRAVELSRETMAGVRDAGIYLPHHGQAVIALALGDPAGALHHLEMACDAPEWMMGYLRVPHFAHLKDEPRYQALLRRVGLPG